MGVAETRGALEQRLLTVSILVTVGVAALGVVFGAVTGSFSILFDGVYALIDAAMSGLALITVRLILRAAQKRGQDAGAAVGDFLSASRFQFGFWHLEPMVLAFNGMLLTLAALYALGNAVLLLMDGGRALSFDWAIVYAAIVVVVCFSMAWWERRMNRLARSDFVEMDVRSWVMSGAITGALLIAFIAGALVEGGTWAHLGPYIDPGVLALVCLAILPVPLGTMRAALADIFIVAPEELDAEVRAAAQAAVARHGVADYRSYVASVGRAVMIEIHLIAGPDDPPRALAAFDAIRDEIGDAIGGRGPNRWLTIAFTARRDLAE